jgi:hypothetical protein
MVEGRGRFGCQGPFFHGAALIAQAPGDYPKDNTELNTRRKFEISIMDCSLYTLKNVPCLRLITEYNFSLQLSPSAHIAVEQSIRNERVEGSAISSSYKQRYNRVTERVNPRRANIQGLTSSRKHVSLRVKWIIKLSSHSENVNECTIFYKLPNQLLWKFILRISSCFMSKDSWRELFTQKLA